MGVSRDEVLRVAALARLELSDDEVDSLVRELADILAHVAELRASNIEHRTSNFELRTTNCELRTGEGAGGDSLSGGLEGMAPDFRDGFFRVPRLGSHEGADSGKDSDSDSDSDSGTHTHTHTHRERP